MSRPLARGEQGMMTGFVAVVCLGLLFAGMAYDGGQIIRANAEARDLAENAARAAAQAIDPHALQGSGAAVVVPTEAAARVDAYLASAGHPGAGQTTVAGDTVTVTVTIAQPMRILPVDTRQVTATAAATATKGVSAEGQLPNG